MKQHTLTTEEKVDLLTKDFLERDENNHFVRIRTTNRLGWESTLPEDSPYSAYLLNPKSQVDLIKNAYGIATDMITAMNTPFKVKILLVNDTSATDTRTVMVATKVFDDPSLETGKKLDTFIGLAIHEGCHLLYTNFGELARIKNETIRALQNIIEDERIERECGEQKPGLANFLKAAKYYYFDLYKNEMDKKGETKGLNTFSRLLNCIISYVRYPKALDVKDLEEFADVMLKIKDTLLPFPSSTDEVIQTAEKIYELIKDYLEHNPEQKGPSKQNQQSQQQNDESSEQKQSQQQNQQQQNKESSEQKQQNPSSESGNDNESQSQSDNRKTAQEQIDEGMADMQEALENIVRKAGKEKLTENEQSQTVLSDKEAKGHYCQGDIELGQKENTYIEKAKENKTVYMDSLSRVKHFIPAIKKKLQCSGMEYQLSLKGMRTGVLDTGKLAEAYQGVPTVYIRNGEVKVQKLSVCILIDESGSMWGPGKSAARDTAILLNEAIKDLPNVNLFIYGHTASHCITNIFVYREGGFHNPYTLGTTDSRAGNHDSIAIREVAARVRKHTCDKVLFFMISDGAPNEGTETVRKAVTDVEKQGFEIVAVSIEPYFDPSTMYRHNVIYSDLSTLAPELGKMVKKAIMDNQKKQINY